MPNLTARARAPTSEHRKRQRRRRGGRGFGASVRGLAAGLAVLGSILVAPDATAADLTAVRLEHTAPNQAVAGDPVDVKVDVARPCVSRSACPSLELTARYGEPLADGSSRTVTAEVRAGDDDATVVLTIPGDAVRYPGLAYDLSASAPELGVTEASDVHRYEVPVALVYRVAFRYPDGLPAKGATVIARSATSPMWVGTTDARGDAVIALADSDIVTAENDTDYSQLFITAFDAVPQNPTEAVAVDGNGSDIATFVNLGNLLIDAVDTQVQDRVFTLQPQTRDFSPRMSSASASTVPNGCQPFPNGEGYVCNERIETIYNVGVPVANNVGGGDEMGSTYTYGDSTFTSSSILVKITGGWTEAEGETTSEERTTMTAGTGRVGPGSNVTATAAFNFARERETWCHQMSCSTTERVRPLKWNSGFYGVGTPGLHDRAAQFQPSDSADCVVKHGAEHTSETSKGHKLRYSIGVEGQARGLSARTRYLNERGSEIKAVHSWQSTGATRTYHHRFVKYGLGTYNTDKDDKCPDTHPELTWTDSSNIDKTAYGPPSRHTTGDVHHGLLRSTNNIGPDRIHGWISHPHGGKTVIVLSCETEQPCRPPSSPGITTATWLCSATGYRYAPVDHVHCEANIDHAAAVGRMYPGTDLEDGGNAPPCVGGEAYPNYADGHGIDCHSMNDILTNGPGAE